MQLILVGGFLGAGKTSLLATAAGSLAARGHRVGLITNDQVPGLVDTAILAHVRAAAGVREVAGSCFCCNFDGFRDAVFALEAGGADIVIAEPVGSCTDLSATIVQPFKELYPAHGIAPLSVLVDPQRVRDVLQAERPSLHADAAYILRVQLEEADLILLSKVDTLSEPERVQILAYLRREFPQAPVLPVSTQHGALNDTWLSRVLETGTAGMHIATVDYDRYANGEAVLGWLNAVVSLRWIGGLEADWPRFVAALFAEMQRALLARAAEVGHLKMLFETPGGHLAANLSSLAATAEQRIEGTLGRLSGLLTINARVQTSPSEIEAITREALQRACHARVAPTITAFHCIQPGRPVPTHRYARVVDQSAD